eukprot:TRINITY_DN3176_c0_g1_i2.p1 TRINITY_DN3176_c0_g1~~TRINITY_DN3176_c0_g1_i2.p1  ORF type:complete len:1546 (+),score=290.25 TRINITY_DN3176_c0_g1_i2:77-4714(+)
MSIFRYFSVLVFFAIFRAIISLSFQYEEFVISETDVSQGLIGITCETDDPLCCDIVQAKCEVCTDDNYLEISNFNSLQVSECVEVGKVKQLTPPVVNDDIYFGDQIFSMMFKHNEGRVSKTNITVTEDDPQMKSTVLFFDPGQRLGKFQNSTKVQVMKVGGNMKGSVRIAIDDSYSDTCYFEESKLSYHVIHFTTYEGSIVEIATLVCTELHFGSSMDVFLYLTDGVGVNISDDPNQSTDTITFDASPPNVWFDPQPPLATNQLEFILEISSHSNRQNYNNTISRAPKGTTKECNIDPFSMSVDDIAFGVGWMISHTAFPLNFEAYFPTHNPNGLYCFISYLLIPDYIIGPEYYPVLKTPIYVDTTPPTFYWGRVPTLIDHSVAFNVMFMISDQNNMINSSNCLRGCKMSCLLDGKPVACSPRGAPCGSLIEGPHNLTINFADGVGNVAKPEVWKWETKYNTPILWEKTMGTLFIVYNSALDKIPVDEGEEGGVVMGISLPLKPDRDEQVKVNCRVEDETQLEFVSLVANNEFTFDNWENHRLQYSLIAIQDFNNTASDSVVDTKFICDFHSNQPDGVYTDATDVFVMVQVTNTVIPYLQDVNIKGSRIKLNDLSMKSISLRGGETLELECLNKIVGACFYPGTKVRLNKLELDVIESKPRLLTVKVPELIVSLLGAGYVTLVVKNPRSVIIGDSVCAGGTAACPGNCIGDQYAIGVYVTSSCSDETMIWDPEMCVTDHPMHESCGFGVGSACVRCGDLDVAARCPGGNRIFGEKGTWQATDFEIPVRCRTPIDRCDGWKPQYKAKPFFSAQLGPSEITASGYSGCSERYEGVMCGSCRAGYFGRGRVCDRCADSILAPLLIYQLTIPALITFTLVAVFYRFSSGNRSQCLRFGYKYSVIHAISFAWILQPLIQAYWTVPIPIDGESKMLFSLLQTFIFQPLSFPDCFSQHSRILVDEYFVLVYGALLVVWMFLQHKSVQPDALSCVSSFEAKFMDNKLPYDSDLMTILQFGLFMYFPNATISLSNLCGCSSTVNGDFITVDTAHQCLDATNLVIKILPLILIFVLLYPLSFIIGLYRAYSTVKMLVNAHSGSIEWCTVRQNLNMFNHVKISSDGKEVTLPTESSVTHPNVRNVAFTSSGRLSDVENGHHDFHDHPESHSSPTIRHSSHNQHNHQNHRRHHLQQQQTLHAHLSQPLTPREVFNRLYHRTNNDKRLILPKTFDVADVMRPRTQNGDNHILLQQLPQYRFAFAYSGIRPHAFMCHFSRIAVSVSIATASLFDSPLLRFVVNFIAMVVLLLSFIKANAFRRRKFIPLCISLCISLVILVLFFLHEENIFENNTNVFRWILNALVVSIALLWIVSWGIGLLKGLRRLSKSNSTNFRFLFGVEPRIRGPSNESFGSSFEKLQRGAMSHLSVSSSEESGYTRTPSSSLVSMDAGFSPDLISYVTADLANADATDMLHSESMPTQKNGIQCTSPIPVVGVQHRSSSQDDFRIENFSAVNGVSMTMTTTSMGGPSISGLLPTIDTIDEENDVDYSHADQDTIL